MVFVYSVQMSIVIGLSLLFHFMNDWKHSRELEKEKMEAELMALRAQLNPHFLFNSLNNIYSLSLDKSDRAPAYILMMSQLTRYILHDSRSEMVSLDAEIEFIRNLLKLESIRLDDDAKFNFNITGSADDIQIAPLLLLPFVENAIKHGVNPNPNEAYVDIHLEIDNEEAISFTVRNRLEMEADLRNESREELAPSGVGLENVKRRLSLLYPGRYQLELKNDADMFTAYLRIEK